MLGLHRVVGRVELIDGEPQWVRPRALAAARQEWLRDTEHDPAGVVLRIREDWRDIAPESLDSNTVRARQALEAGKPVPLFVDTVTKANAFSAGVTTNQFVELAPGATLTVRPRTALILADRYPWLLEEATESQTDPAPTKARKG